MIIQIIYQIFFLCYNWGFRGKNLVHTSPKTYQCLQKGLHKISMGKFYVGYLKFHYIHYNNNIKILTNRKLLIHTSLTYISSNTYVLIQQSRSQAQEKRRQQKIMINNHERLLWSFEKLFKRITL